MDETILVPSPNWFEVSILGVASDGWVVYGGPNKSLVALEPLPHEYKGAIAGDHRFQAHVATRAHKEKISCVEISPEWPEKRHIITASPDGSVKEWSITKGDNKKFVFKTMQTNSSHVAHKEEVASVGYSSPAHVISIGSFGVIAKWELASNLVKTYPNLMHNFRATCMSCSPHLPFHVAVGTKQGVIFVIDLSANGKVLCKVRGQDDDITQLSWCPQYEVNVNKSIEDSRQKKSFLVQRLEKIRNEQEPAELETSGIEKKLPDDSFDGSIVQEDDTFDIYKDHEAEEFGHKKYVPEDIYVKQKAEPVKSDFLEECQKLKADILKLKEADEQSLASLVESMENANINKTDGNSSKDEIQDNKNDSKDSKEVCSEKENGIKPELPTDSNVNKVIEEQVDANPHIHRHLLASIGKFGSIRIWTKTGKVLASCSINTNTKSKNYKQPQYCTLCWYTPDRLLFSDGKNQLLECNPLHIDSKSKLTYKQVHTEHRRGLYCIMTDAPRLQTPGTGPHKPWSVWTVGQDRLLVKYSLDQRKVLGKLASCGGHLYEIKTCPYDVGKIAVAVGDGAVRVWETHLSPDNSQLVAGAVHCHWQHVLGKVVTCAWHPDKENLLAFATAESRVGLVETGGAGERAARVLRPGLSGGVYSACWAARALLLAAAAPHAALYCTAQPDAEPRSFPVVVEGQQWAVSAVSWCTRGVAAGSAAGGVALLTLDGDVIAAKFVCSKMVQTIDWHPQQTSSSDTESQYKDLCAVCSLDRDYTIVVLQLVDKEDGGKQFVDFMKLHGHTEIVYKVCWSPHHDEQLLSTSNDHTVRIWNAIAGECLAIFPGHGAPALAAAWAAEPGLATRVLSGGADCCMRLWNLTDYPPHSYREVKVESKKKRRAVKKKKNKEEAADKPSSDSEHDDAGNVAGDGDYKMRMCKKFLLPMMSRQINVMNLASVTSVLQKHFAQHTAIEDIQSLFNDGWTECDVHFLKMFGSINSLNEILDMEAANHLALKNNESFIMLLIVRGHIDQMIQFANENDLLDPFLLNMTLCVSVKFWKDVTKLYTAHLDRLAAKGEEDKLTEGYQYGGVPYRKLAALLSIHDVMGALDVLKGAALYKEAYVLSRLRHMESVSSDILRQWAADAAFTGNLTLAALIHLALGNISDAATILRRSTKPECLSLAVALAKAAGLPTFADFMETKAKNAEKPKCEDTLDDLLEELPTKMELLLKDSAEVNGDKSDIVPE